MHIYELSDQSDFHYAPEPHDATTVSTQTPSEMDTAVCRSGR